MPCRSAVASTNPDRALDRADRVLLEPEREREIEQHLGVGRAGDRAEERRLDLEHQVSVHVMEAVQEAVVHEEPAAVTERVTVGLLHGAADGCPDVREKER